MMDEDLADSADDDLSSPREYAIHSPLDDQDQDQDQEQDHSPDSPYAPETTSDVEVDV